MSKPPKIRLERLPNRDAVIRLRTAYACLERGLQTGRQAAGQQTKAKPSQEEES